MSTEIPGILDSTKKALGLSSEYVAFDSDLIMFINGTFSTLTQLGVGPPQGFAIGDQNATWAEFLGGDDRMNFVKNFMFIKVRLLFDPPETSFAIAAFEKQAAELAWRINAQREEDRWTALIL